MLRAAATKRQDSHMVEAEHPDGWIPSTEEDRRAIRDHLEQMLSHPLFRNSKRYPNFLRHLVEQTLAGKEAELKERLLGMAVFHRAPDYDTNQDTVVRLTAGEVRKRIAQYYHQPEHAGQMQIDLLPGSYVPIFRRPASPGARNTPQAEQGAVDDLRPQHDPEANGAGATSAPGGPRVAPPSPLNASVIAATWTDRRAPLPGNGLAVVPVAAAPAAEISPPPRRGLQWLAAFLLLALAASGGYWWRADQLAHRADRQLWTPMLDEPGPVQLVVADLSATVSNAEASELRQNAGLFDILRMGELVNYRDSLAMTGIAAFLAKHNKPYAVSLSTQATYPELQRSASILIGGLDNVWTMRVTSGLRYHLVSRVPDRSGGSYSFGIEDRQHPEQGGWNGDLAKPTDRITEDYALVARLFDQTTGRPVLVVAGLGANGTSAAAQFLLDPARNAELAAHAPKNWQRLNMEAVLKTQILDNHAGPPRLVVCTFW
jgi:hypothetical protein